MPGALDCLELRLGYRFLDPSLLPAALVHRSARQGSGATSAPTGGDNERLEFLGDSVLGLQVARLLFLQLPTASEGELSKAKAYLVGEACLAEHAKTLGLDDYLVLGGGEEASGRSKPALLADAFEAVLGAMYLDGGEAELVVLLRTLVGPAIERRDWTGIGRDCKTELQELTMARHGVLPDYHLLAVLGPLHNPTFDIEVRLGATPLGRGCGPSKKAAGQAAARAALANLFAAEP